MAEEGGAPVAQIPTDERIELAGQLAMRARIFYDLWWLYEGADTRPQILDTMNAFSEFFRFDSHAHFVAFVVHIATLFERRSDTVNLPVLIGEVDALASTVEAMTEAKHLVEQVQPLASKVVILRSNLFAHRSASLSYAEAFRKAAVAPNELRTLADAALRVVNCLRAARGREGQGFDDLSRRHLAAMLQVLSDRRAT